jgi:hypothetical protein
MTMPMLLDYVASSVLWLMLPLVMLLVLLVLVLVNCANSSAASGASNPGGHPAAEEEAEHIHVSCSDWWAALKAKRAADQAMPVRGDQSVAQLDPEAAVRGADVPPLVVASLVERP